MHFEIHWPLIVCGTVQLFTESEVPRIVKWAVRETLLILKCCYELLRQEFDGNSFRIGKEPETLHEFAAGLTVGRCLDELTPTIPRKHVSTDIHF